MKSLEYVFKTYISDYNIEDGESYFHRNNLFVVVEGAGGEYFGEIAREQACKIIPETFFQQLSRHNSPAAALIESFEEANKAIINERAKLGRKMAASVCAVFISQKIMYFTHLGDSRIYLFQKGELNQLTKDHTVKEEDPFAEKRIRDTRALRALTQGLGIRKNPSIEVKKYPLNKKGIILVTTAALTERVSDREILWQSTKSKNLKKLSHSLIDIAKRKGGKGVMTIGIIRFGGFARSLKNVLFTYSVFFIVILAAIGVYVLKYGGEGRDVEKIVSTRSNPEDDRRDDSRVVEQKTSDREIKTATNIPSAPVNEERTGASIAESPKETGAAQFNKIYTFIVEWKTAWEKTAGENGDLEKYISFYAKDFQENGLDRDGWRQDKAAKGRKKSWIRVEISDIKISAASEESRIEVRFSQNYQSSNYSGKSEKMLILVKEGKEWKIARERSY